MSHRRASEAAQTVRTPIADGSTGSWFMGRGVFQILDTYWDHEPDRPKGVTKPSRGQRPRNGVSIVASALKGRAQSVGRLVRPFRAEWGFGMGFPRALPWAGFREGRWPLDTDHTPTGVVHGEPRLCRKVINPE